MPRRVAISTLNASTIDILNVIRQNADAQYQANIPVVTQESDIPKVGEILYGYPALANQFINALVNRIAQVRVKSAQFNNAYASLKKGFLEFGETVEEVFVNITKARGFSVEKAPAREFKRTMPDVKSAFHVMNYRVQYPITIQKQDLKRAFLSISGVEDLIAKIVGSVNVAAEYDEFLLFKYLIIKGVSHGKMYPVEFDTSDLKNAAEAFRGYSNQLTFMSDKYNSAHVKTTTPKNDQYIFMDAMFNAQYDVNVLASAFNMDKTTFMGKLNLIDDFTTFDNDRFSEIMADSTAMETVTDTELALMQNVKAILLDGEWFQIYDELSEFSETFVASGLYWNYFYNVWKTISTSPFSNAIVFVGGSADITLPDTVTVEVTNKDVSEMGTVLTLTPNFESAALHNTSCKFVQTSAAVTAGIGVQPYGAYLIPANASGVTGELVINGTHYESGSNAVVDTLDVGDTLTFTSEDYIPNTLSSLTIGASALSPTFSSTVTAYTLSTTTSPQKITATPTSSDATVVIKNGSTVIANEGNATWSAGANTLTVEVKGYSRGEVSTKTYTVTVTKS